MYSQNEEEKVILDYFKGKTGSFIDFGANDGMTFSNTLALSHIEGWQGVLVEPSPEAFKKLTTLYRNRKGFYCYRYAIGETNGIVKFQDSGSHLSKDDSGLLSTMSESDYNKWRGVTEYKEIDVQCYRWKTFLNRLAIKEFDFISMDIEGLEIPVLEQMDLRSTSMVCVEFNGDSNKKLEFDKLMIGFRLIYTSSENLIYAR